MVFSLKLKILAILAVQGHVASAEGTAGYQYEFGSSTGPEMWASLPVDGNQCGGQKNSPIAVETRPCDRYENYFLYPGECSMSEMKFEVVDNGVKASYPTDGTCNLNSVEIPGIDGTYEALQFHVHLSSEHTIDGKFFGAELHVVHKQTNADRYAVVGFMLHPGARLMNPIFEGLLYKWEEAAVATELKCGQAATNATLAVGGKHELELFNVYEMLSDNAAFFHYDGGLTTPPCSEVVWWNLADEPVMISTAQYHKLVQLVMKYRDPSSCSLATLASSTGSTSRPVQPLNGRVVERICPSSYAPSS